MGVIRKDIRMEKVEAIKSESDLISAVRTHMWDKLKIETVRMINEEEENASYVRVCRAGGICKDRRDRAGGCPVSVELEKFVRIEPRSLSVPETPP